jgi:hypothetical protein
MAFKFGKFIAAHPEAHRMSWALKGAHHVAYSGDATENSV